MLPTSCTVGGIEYIGSLLVFPTRLRFGALGEISTATLEFIGIAADLGPVLIPNADVSLSSGEAGGSSVFGEIVPGETVFGEGGESTANIFIGKVASVETKAVTVKGSGTGYTRFTLQCQGLEAGLVDAVVTADATYTTVSDGSIIAAVFAAYAPSINIDNVTDVEASVSLTVRNGWTMRQVLDEVISRGGGTYYMRGSSLYHHGAASSAAPFNIKELEDCGASDIAPLWANFKHSLTWTNRTNRVVVLGALGNAGVRYTATEENLTSQGLYGIISRTITDANIQSNAEASLRGAIEVANYANPQETGTFETRTDGFYVGQSITITMPSEVLASAMFIRSVSWAWVTPTVVTYTCEFGQFSSNLVRQLTRMLADMKEKPYTPIAVPAPLSVGLSSFAATIEAVGLVTATPNGSEELAIALTTKVVYNTTDKKTYRWDSSSNTYKRRVGATDLEEDSVTAGTIAVGAIRAVDAAFDAGAIQTADIGNAQITTAKIANLAVTAAQIDNATITGAKIASATIQDGNIVNATITAASIANATITGAKIAGATITAANIANATITNAEIANATITSAKIVSLDASKITGGTITATITLNSAGDFTVVGSAIFNSGVDIDISLSVGPLGGYLNVNSSTATFGVDIDCSVINATQIDASTSISCSGNISATSGGGFRIGSTTVINSSQQFVGAGALCGSSGIGAGGFNPWNGAGYDTGGTQTFSNGGLTWTFKGGAFISAV